MKKSDQYRNRGIRLGRIKREKSKKEKKISFFFFIFSREIN